MQQINYSSLEHRDKRSKYASPAIAAMIGVIALMIMIAGPLYFSDFFLSIDVLVMLLGLVLFAAFVILLHRLMHATQIRRDKLLRAFAADNQFTFTRQRSIMGGWYIPEFISTSALLSPGYRLSPRSDMMLTGTYEGVSFSLTVVGMYWSRLGQRAGVSYFGTIIIHAETLGDLPHIIALSKSTSRLLSSLNTEVIKDPAWQSRLVGWEANARYDIYAKIDGMRTNANGPTISRMLADIHTLTESDVEINGSDLYIIDIDGIEYTQEGLQSVFNKIAVAARYLKK
ncbi:MAG: hypothetical protein ABWX94_00135 [Candidatus Saccharimonadales bacterium]